MNSNNKMMGLLKLGASNTQAGKAATMAMKGLGSLIGCSGNQVAGNDSGEIIAPKGEQMCLVVGSQEIPVVLQEDLTTDRMGVYATFPDGVTKPVDAQYLVPWHQCFGDGK